MKNIKETLEQIKEIRNWSFCVNKERFMGYAKAMYPTLGDREIESVWRIWENVSAFNLYQLKDKSEALILTAMKIAHTVYDSVHKGAHVHWSNYTPKTNQWRVYYRYGEDGKVMQIDVDLREKEDVLKYASLLQQEEVGILHRLDFYEKVTVSCASSGLKDKKISIYDGDIIFCSDEDRWSVSENSGAYLCIDGAYKRLMYTPGRGYICRGEPDYEQNKDGSDCRYNNYAFNAYDRRFWVVGNIYTDNSVLIEKKEE